MPDDPAMYESTPPMVSFVAPSGTGKTTLLERVIADLTDRGLKVTAVKHDAHRVELDTEGKDSWRLRQAGATDTILVSRSQVAWMGSTDGPPSLDDLVTTFAPGTDLVLVEGFRSAGLPSVVVSRPGAGDGRWEPPDPSTVVLTVEPDEVDRVVDYLLKRISSSD